jgi:16S rRNA (uracil1498-N3)-methyltransferase
MHRFYIPPADWNPDALELGESEAHHCIDVLRLGPGDRVIAFNGQGAEATAEIVTTGRDKVTLRTLQQTRTAPLPCEITLGQAIPKGKNMDLIVQKATELGAARIVPLLSERTVIHLDDGDVMRKQEKWQATVIEAAKQCGQNRLPEVARPQTLRDLFASQPVAELMLIASLQPHARRFDAVLGEHIQNTGRRPRSALVLVGPEGDFTPAEINFATGSGCQPITLGPIVLRTETAAIYCLSILSYELLREA